MVEELKMVYCFDNLHNHQIPTVELF